MKTKASRAQIRFKRVVVNINGDLLKLLIIGKAAQRAPDGGIEPCVEVELPSTQFRVGPPIRFWTPLEGLLHPKTLEQIPFDYEFDGIY